MSARIVRNEIAKLRRLRIGALLLALALVATAMTALGSNSPDFDPAAPAAWNLLLMGLNGGVMIASPLLIAALASRIVDIEHQGGGWLLSAASGTTPGVLCRAKLAVLGTALVAVLCMLSAGTAAAGLALGISAPWPAGRWIGATVCLIVVDLVLVALHLLLSARVENQLVGLGIGLLGMIIALVAPMLPVAIQHLVPWGYFALSEAAGYVGSEIEPLRPAYPSIAALGVLAAVLFGLTTRSFDRREA